MASQDFPRIYHSGAVLLPDGRVLTVGGNNIRATEVYEPPYLFKGARPTISSAPTNVNYGQTFFVETPNAASITEVTWIRLSSVTHSNNMEQRFSRLNFSQVADGLNVVAPSSPNLAPPGYYMLFILNSDGVPSVAEIVRINAAPGDTLPPNTNITAGPTGTITENTASFTWSGDDDITPTGDLVYATRLEPLETAFSAFGSATTKSYSNLANGNYTFHVKARDQAGNEDTTPATRAFTVSVIIDTLPPTTNITAGPTGTITVSTSSFTWSGDDNITPTESLVYATSARATGDRLFSFWQCDDEVVLKPSQWELHVPREGQGPSRQRIDTGNPCFYSQGNWRCLSRRDHARQFECGPER